MNMLDGKTIRNQILAKIQKDIKENGRDVHLAVITVGDNTVCQKYVALKKKLAEQCGIFVSVYCFGPEDKESTVLDTIKFLNQDEEVNGIMIQIPVAEWFNQEKLIEAIAPEKDVDGLRYCLGEKSDFVPPVVLAIAYALRTAYSIQESVVSILKDKKVVIVGEGFLVGGPLKNYLHDQGVAAVSINKINSSTIEQLNNADIVISAVGKAGLIHPEMVKDDVVLIDAGTSESNGELKGDIDPECYTKASFYTPVPGGVGPLTIAFLMKNLVN